MTNVFRLGYTTTSSDLVAYFTDSDDNLFDPYYLSYTIKYVDNNHNDIIGQEDRIPTRISKGVYYPSFTINLKWPEGTYYIVWIYRSNDSSYDRIKYGTENFKVSSIYGLSGIQSYTGSSYTSNNYYTMTGMGFTGIGYTSMGWTGLGYTGIITISF